MSIIKIMFFLKNEADEHANSQPLDGFIIPNPDKPEPN